MLLLENSCGKFAKMKIQGKILLLVATNTIDRYVDVFMARKRIRKYKI